MAEPTLSLTLNDLKAEVGLFLGFGRGAAFSETSWTTQQSSVIDSCVRSGLRQFYFPPPLDGETSAYDWSFLRPTASLGIASGASTVPLPDDFGGIEGQVTISSPTNAVLWPLDVVGEGRIRQCYEMTPSNSGRPMLAAVRPLKGTQQDAGQRWELYIYPTTDQAYTFQFQYYLNPDALSDSFPYAYGGMQHAETILESCLAIAEQRLDDASTVHAMKYRERLSASVSKDRQSKPQKLGYNSDRSDFKDNWMTRGDLHFQQLVKVYGTQY